MYHAKSRIAKKVKRGHPDYYDAIKHLGSIFRKIINGEYNTEDEFIGSMEQWIERWSDPLQASANDEKQKLKDWGMYLEHKHHVDIVTGTLLQGKEVDTSSRQPQTAVLSDEAIHTARNQIKGWNLRGLFDIKYVDDIQGTFSF